MFRRASVAGPGSGGDFFLLFFSLNFISSQNRKKQKQKKLITPNQSIQSNHPQKTIPASMGLCLELAYPIITTNGSSEFRDVSTTGSSSFRGGDSAPFRHRLPLNSFIDSILRTVYHASAPPPDGHGVRRQIIFTSSSPDACAAVNWKQPNCQFLSFILFSWHRHSHPGNNQTLNHRLCLFLTRSGLIRIVVRRRARQPTEQHYGIIHTQQSYTRFAFDEY
jgi:hypothetical protein